MLLTKKKKVQFYKKNLLVYSNIQPTRKMFSYSFTLSDLWTMYLTALYNKSEAVCAWLSSPPLSHLFKVLKPKA